ncbi:uncharacterized protein LOC129280991 [Lytechinus pictus]|uniref:uncharacterized protein LOC129280991 n=1 Tax=Lytechinus pictus TaxID=7653 RepID=UPI0030B9FA92
MSGSSESIKSEDSASQGGKSSTASSRIKTKAKKAALAAELASLKEQHELELQEFHLQQKKAQFMLETKLKVAAAEEAVYEQFDQHPSQLDIKIEPTSEELGQQQQPIQPQIQASEHRNNVRQENLEDTMPYPQHNQDLYQYQQIQDRLLEAISLSNVEIMKFNGNPLHYHEFMACFDNLIGSSTLDRGTKLMKLYQCCEGDVKNIIQCCMVMDPVLGYQRARELLRERFGSRFKIGEAWIEQITNGSALHANDRTGLRKFADELQVCLETLKALNLTKEISSNRELVKLAERLPFHLKARWLKVVRDIRQRGRSPDITDMVKFVSDAAEEVNDPVFGELTATSPRSASKPSFNKQHSKSSYSTAVTDNSSFPKPKKCFKCYQDHTLFGCDSFKSLTPDERFKFAQENRLCFNCLQQGHTSRICKLNRTCSVPGCQRKHTKFLHLFRESLSPERGTPHQEIENQPQPNKHLISSSTQTPFDEIQTAQNSFIDKSVTGAGRCVLPIVPVRVRAHNESQSVETYALLDTGSTSTFCTAALSRQLNAVERKQSLNLSTLGRSNSTVDTSVVSLIVDTGKDTEIVKLPRVYTRESINVKESHIAKMEDIRGWNHLEGINIPIVTQHEVGLLIGQDVPGALIPIEIRASEDGPYAVRTKLGWAVSGPVQPKMPEDIHTATTSFVGSDIKLEDGRLQIFRKNESSEVLQKDKVSSINVSNASAFRESSGKKDGVHNLSPTSFEKKTPKLPDDILTAEQRLQSSPKRLLIDDTLQKKHQVDVEHMLSNYSIMKVNKTEQLEDITSLYLPHHLIISPQVISDCVAKHNEEALPDKVPQGPDLANLPRVSPGKPLFGYMYFGVDSFTPYIVKQRNSEKGYG